MSSTQGSIFSPSSIQTRQLRSAKVLANTLSDFGVQESSVLLVLSGEPIQKPGGLDQTYPFLPHPEYYWLSGSRRSGEVMSFVSNGSNQGQWIRWYREASDIEKLWEGEPEIGVPAQGGEAYQEVQGLKAWLSRLNPARIFVFGNTTALASHLPASLAQRVVGMIPTDMPLLAQLQFALDSQRRIKDAQEIELLKKSALATAEGFKVASSLIQPGCTERQIQIALEAAAFNAGGMGTGYGTLVGTGARSAVLHCEPNSTVIQKDEFVLIDAGAEIFEYTSDVTRTFYSSSKNLQKMGQKHQIIYDTVLEAQRVGISLCKPGTEWRVVHLAAAQVIAQGLKDLGLITCTAETAVEGGAVGLFFPHGVGHLVGLRVRDVGGRVLNRPEGMAAGARLRVDLPLEAGFVVTVEPGIYFVDAILKNSANREKFKDQVAWSKLDAWYGLGGVRIEDNIHVTGDGPHNLTAAIPK